MSFFALILKNLLRRPSRSLLTVLGIAIGICAVVALSSLAWGFEHTWENTYKARGIDLAVVSVFESDLFPGSYDSNPIASPARGGLPSNATTLSGVTRRRSPEAWS